MAEVLGAVASGLTLASLLKVCLDAFDLIQASRNQELDYQKLVLKLNIEKCRLYVGQAMHLIPVDGQAQTSPLDSFVFRSLVFSILETMQRLFYDSEKLKNRYGCQPSSQLRLDSIETSSISRALAAAFADFKVDGSTEAVQSNYVQKTWWLIHDHKKFKALISDIKDFVDGLQNITMELSPKPFQESAIRRRISLIEDVATLEVVAEVCETDHPSFSETASQKWDIISIFTGSGRDIEHWSDAVEPFVDPEIADWENLSITELRHQMVQLLEKHKQLQAKVSATTSEEQQNTMRERNVQQDRKHEPTVEAAEIRPSEPPTLPSGQGGSGHAAGEGAVPAAISNIASEDPRYSGGSFAIRWPDGRRWPLDYRTLSDQQRMEAELLQHYSTLEAYLRGRAPQPLRPTKRRDKLPRLSPVQFHEVSTDVFDELQRRQASAASAPGQPPPRSVPQYLLPRNDFHEKRNQARQKLSSLQDPRFRDLSTDVFCELERRFPTFSKDGQR